MSIRQLEANMIKALYTASSGLVAQSTKQDVIAHNIANAGTTGFKKMRVVSASFAHVLRQGIESFGDRDPKMDKSTPARFVTCGVQSVTDNTPGAMRPTGNPLDTAIEGPGAFEVRYPYGNSTTRAGAFKIDSDGELATLDGGKVLGQNGPIHLPEGKVEIGEDGSISVDGNQVDSINITGADPGKTRLLQGSLEASNVNIVTEMVEMITNVRAFEANQKIVSSVDDTLNKLINEAGRVV